MQPNLSAQPDRNRLNAPSLVRVHILYVPKKGRPRPPLLWCFNFLFS